MHVCIYKLLFSFYLGLDLPLVQCPATTWVWRHVIASWMVTQNSLVTQQPPPLIRTDEKPRAGRIAELFVYDNFNRVAVDSVDAGDICALTGLGDVSIGETICDRNNPVPLPTITVSFAIHGTCMHIFPPLAGGPPLPCSRKTDFLWMCATQLCPPLSCVGCEADHGSFWSTPTLAMSSYEFV